MAALGRWNKSFIVATLGTIIFHLPYLSQSAFLSSKKAALLPRKTAHTASFFPSHGISMAETTSSETMATSSPATPPVPPKSLSTWAGFMFLIQAARGLHHQYMYRLMKEHGECFMIWNKYVILNDARAIRDVLEVENLPKSADVRRGFKTIFYRKGGILAAPWKRWIEERRTTAPALSEAAVGELAPRFYQGAKPILELLEQAAGNGTVLEMDQCFTALTLDTIGLVCLGRSFGMGERLLHGNEEPVPFSAAVRVLEREALRQMTLPLRILKWFRPGEKFHEARQVVDDFLEDCIAARIREREVGVNKDITDLINILLDAEADGLITRDDVKGQLFVFLFAGHDTTAHTLTWLLYEVSLNEDLQESLYQEIRAALPDKDGFVLDPSVLRHKLPLLDAVWQETNRLHPAAATGPSRVVGRSSLVIHLENGQSVRIPPRVNVSIPPYALHRNPKYWPDPLVFNPSRFLDKNANEKRDPMSFLPFSAGPRNCIGARLARAEALSVISALLRRFRIRNVEKQHPPREFVSLTMKPKYGIRFQFELREE